MGVCRTVRAAEELLEEAVEPFVGDMKRYLEIGLEDQARQFCQGVLLGPYRVRDGRDNDILNWSPDFRREAAGNALEVWSETGWADREGAPAKKRRRRLSPDFVREHMPNWDWVLKTTARSLIPSSALKVLPCDHKSNMRTSPT